MARQPLKRPAGHGTTQGPPPKMSYLDFEAGLPNLFSHLFDERYEDGERRTTSTLLFFVEAGTLKCCLNDREAGRVVFLAVQSIPEGLHALESGLLDDTLDWKTKRSS